MTEAELRTREMIYDDQGRAREGVVVVKFIGKYGPYGYRVIYQRGLIGEGRHEWEYLGRAEPGLSTGTYAPRVPLRFFRGHAKDIRDKRLALVGNWSESFTDAELGTRLENAGYLEEVIE
jgi:hypothetical protein